MKELKTRVKNLTEYLETHISLITDKQKCSEICHFEHQYKVNLKKSSMDEKEKKLFRQCIQKQFCLEYFPRNELEDIQNYFSKDNVDLAALSQKVRKELNLLFVTAQYVENYNLYWDYIAAFEGMVLIAYGSIYCLVPKNMLCDIKKAEDMNNITVNQLQGVANEGMSLVPDDLKDVTLSQVNKARTQQEAGIEQLQKNIQDIKDCKNNELAALQEEIQLKKMQLEARQRELMQELNKKREEMETALKKLNQQVYMLQTQIYSIRCFHGETVELIQLRNGKNASDQVPFVMNQKILYLDEDLARLVSVYNANIEQEYRILEEAIKYNDDVFDAFCHQEKCITFFRVSKSDKAYTTTENNIIEAYEMMHGKKIGFLVRNGDNLYCGWMEDEWKEDTPITFEEELFMRNGSAMYDEIESEESLRVLKSTSTNERVSRLFALSILQGLIDQKHILNFPEPISILKSSKYIVFNYADRWIDDNRYGDFNTLANNLHHYNREGDTILVLQFLGDSEKGRRGIGYNNRVRDCSVSSGIHLLNKISEGCYYVSVEKRWSESGARSNFEVDTNEFFNLTYFNSLWMEYYITTKKVGKFGLIKNGSGLFSSYSNMSYSYIIPYFRKALFFLREREAKEKELIEQYFQDIDDIPEWQIKLSHWKILNKVRNITDFQAKRFASYLSKGKFLYVKNLFREWNPPVCDNLDRYYNATPLRDFRLFRSQCSRYTYCGKDGYPEEFSWENMDSTFEYFSGEITDEIFESANKLADIDYRKVRSMQEMVVSFLRQHHIEEVELKKHLYTENGSDNSVRIEVENFCSNFSIYQPILNYHDFVNQSDNKERFRNLLKFASKYSGYTRLEVSETLYPLYYYRILQDNLILRVNWAIKTILSEHYKYASAIT